MNTGCISPLVHQDKKEDKKYHCILGGGKSARDIALSQAGGFEVRIWNLIFEEELGSIAGHFGPVNVLAFFKDGRGFVSGGEEGVVRVVRFHSKYFSDMHWVIMCD